MTVLQIASGMYFTSDHAHETMHRRIMYSNAVRLLADDIELPMITLRFSSGHSAISPVTVEVLDRLETVNRDGTDSILIATSGDELVSDAADVVSFGLNVLISSDVDLVRRLIQTPQNHSGRGDATKRLRRTFDPAVYIRDEEFADLRDLSERLLQLRRPHFEAAMRAIRRVVDASTLAADDVTLSYTLFVAALESLSKDANVVPVTWGEYDGRKRSVVDAACEGLPGERVERIRNAVLEIDQLSIRRKFRAFVLDHVTPDFYRREAVAAARPVKAVDLPLALDFAYKLRSRSMHDLRDLAPELWRVSNREDTIWFDSQTVLSLEGLSRLCRHVIRQFIERAPVGLDLEFQKVYRDAIPGIVRMRLAPQMWIGAWNSFSAQDGPTLLDALLEMIISAGSGDAGAIVDLAAPLERIEQLLPGEAKLAARVPLIATYLLWHSIAPKQFHRPKAQRWINDFQQDLDTPSLAAFAVGIFLGKEPPWTTQQLVALVDTRQAELKRGGRRMQLLPERLDAAFQIGVAKRLWAEERRPEAMARVAKAIELLPGDEQLMALEETDENDDLPLMDLFGFVMNRSIDDQENDDVNASSTGSVEN